MTRGGGAAATAELEMESMRVYITNHIDELQTKLPLASPPGLTTSVNTSTSSGARRCPFRRRRLAHKRKVLFDQPGLGSHECRERPQ